MRLIKIVYNAIPLTFTFPCRPYVPSTQATGAGVEWSAARVPSAWVTRWDNPLTVPQRFFESEWPAVRAWIQWAQAGGTFAWYPDASQSTNYTCYLLSPATGEKVEPAHTEYPTLWELSYTIVRTTGAAIDVSYY